MINDAFEDLKTVAGILADFFYLSPEKNTKRLRKDDDIDSVQPSAKRIRNSFLQEPSDAILETYDELFFDFNYTFDILNTTPSQDLLERISIAKKRPLSPQLASLISKNDLLKIYDYFLTSSPFLLSTLSPGESIYLDKRDTGLPRTINVLYSQDEGMKLIIETKSKRCDGKKRSLEKKSGTTKKGKPAWRVDSEQEIEYFNAVVQITSPANLVNLRNEVSLSQQFYSDNINRNELGQKFTAKNGNTKISVYSIKAHSDLKDLLTTKVLLSSQQKNQMILDLLNAVKAFHDKGYVHQDLKPANILVYGDATNGYKLKLTDYGLSTPHCDPNSTALATLFYHSPEIAKIHAKPSDEYYLYYYESVEARDCLASQYARQYINTLGLRAPHKANDIWALGIIVYEILYNKLPKDIYELSANDHPLIKALLNPERKSRVDIDRALEIYKELNSPVLSKKLGI